MRGGGLDDSTSGWGGRTAKGWDVHGLTHRGARLRPDDGRRPVATGHRERHDGLDWVVYTRRVARPVETVWAALADPAQRARWVGTSTRSGAGTGEFLFTFEGEDLLPMTYRLDHVEPGRSAGVSLRDPGAERSWRLEVDLLGDGDHTVLRVQQTILNAAIAPSVAAGCEFYLDRLVAHVEQREPASFDYDEYFLAQAGHYRRLFPVQRVPSLVRRPVSMPR